MARKTFKKVIVTPELLAQVNPKNIELRDLFLKEKNARSSDKTIISYLSDLNIFFIYNLLYNSNKFFVDIKKIELSMFFSYALEELKWSGARYRRMKSCLSSFSNFILKFFDEEYPSFKNIVLTTVETIPKDPIREKTVLSDEQIAYLFARLEEDGETQIICWLALALASGARFSELLRFTTDDISLNNLAYNGIFLETLNPIKSKGRTKLGKLSKKYIVKDLFWDKYQTWIPIREKILLEHNKNHTLIFIDKNGDPAKESVARGWVSKIQSYIDVPFYPHCLRHNLVSKLKLLKFSDELIQSLFDWSDPKMVATYSDIEVKDREWDELNNLQEYLEKSKLVANSNLLEE